MSKSGDQPLKILVKLPNKLGDTIMSTSFLRAVKNYYPNCQLDVIMISGILDLKKLMPYVDHVYPFSKKEYSGPLGNYKFGRMIRKHGKYDLFFCLPFSFSSAIAGFFTDSKKRIGHDTEHRGFLFTNRYTLPPGLHVVDDYLDLFQQFVGEKVAFNPPELSFVKTINFPLPDKEYIILNVCSGPPSRFIPITKAVSIIQSLGNYPYKIVLTGAPNEEEYIGEIERQAGVKDKVVNLAGKTSIEELGWVLAHGKVMITTDSGNAHFANALGTKTVVLFGPGLQSRCHPYHKKIFRPLQLLDMECVPCRSEHCKYEDNRCLSEISNDSIIHAMEELLSQED